MKQPRDWPTVPWLPAMTTAQALGVIVLGLVIGGFLPRVDIGAGFGLNFGNLAVALGFGVAAFSRKKPTKRELRRGAAQHRDE